MGLRINGFLILVIAFFNLFSETSSAENKWLHLPLKSKEGTSIVMDYQFINGSYEPHHQQLYHFADNIWINIYTNDLSVLTQNDNVNAIFTIYRNQKRANNNDFWILDSTLNVTLYWNGRNFTGPIKGIDQFGFYTTRFPIYSVGAFGEYEYRQEVVFTVNKNDRQINLIDPVSNSPNFKFDLYKRALEQGID